MVFGSESLVPNHVLADLIEQLVVGESRFDEIFTDAKLAGAVDSLFVG